MEQCEQIYVAMCANIRSNVSKYIQQSEKIYGATYAKTVTRVNRFLKLRGGASAFEGDPFAFFTSWLLLSNNDSF